tara:strand:+ start:851 stop:982 length:132 start_codon:yes stop_codon:yes gene_type:complete
MREGEKQIGEVSDPGVRASHQPQATYSREHLYLEGALQAAAGV